MGKRVGFARISNQAQPPNSGYTRRRVIGRSPPISTYLQAALQPNTFPRAAIFVPAFGDSRPGRSDRSFFGSLFEQRTFREAHIAPFSYDHMIEYLDPDDLPGGPELSGDCP